MSDVRVCTVSDTECYKNCRSGPCKLEPSGDNATARVHAAAQRLIELANLAGLVVTITRSPLKPLAMGHAAYVVDTWPVRSPS